MPDEVPPADLIARCRAGELGNKELRSATRLLVWGLTILFTCSVESRTENEQRHAEVTPCDEPSSRASSQPKTNRSAWPVDSKTLAAGGR